VLRQGFVVASSVDVIAREGLNQIKKFTCDGEPVSALYGCIWDGQICSDAGTCTNGACVCNSGREGQYCQEFTSSGSSDVVVLLGTLAQSLRETTSLTYALSLSLFLCNRVWNAATIIPVASVIFCLLLAFILVLFFVIKRKGNRSDDWEISYDELEVGEHLGSGGYGEVHKAIWKGTEVAVKVMASDKISKEMEKGFKEEVRVMTSLRHPNVVLFMAASTKAPKMCIVMEFMALGSLYDVRHHFLTHSVSIMRRPYLTSHARSCCTTS
jgi:preprotein translocase subunit YajC